SFLYKDNPLFRFTESMFAGVSLGYYVGTTLNQTLVPNLIKPLTHDFHQNWDLLVPGLLGLLLYMRYVPKTGWVARYALGIYVAYYIGLDFTRRIHGEVLPQLGRAIVPLSKLDSHTIFYSLVFAVGVFSVLIYFFFSKEQDAVTRRIARVGTWFLMVSFAAAESRSSRGTCETSPPWGGLAGARPPSSPPPPRSVRDFPETASGQWTVWDSGRSWMRRGAAASVDSSSRRSAPISRPRPPSSATSARSRRRSGGAGWPG